MFNPYAEPFSAWKLFRMLCLTRSTCFSNWPKYRKNLRTPLLIGDSSGWTHGYYSLMGAFIGLMGFVRVNDDSHRVLFFLHSSHFSPGSSVCSSRFWTAFPGSYFGTGSFKLSAHLYRVSLLQRSASFDLGRLTSSDISGMFTISFLLADPSGVTP